jgi:hypothetical protein
MSHEKTSTGEIMRRIREVLDGPEPVRGIATVIITDDNIIVCAGAPAEYSDELAKQLRTLADQVDAGEAIDQPLN